MGYYDISPLGLDTISAIAAPAAQFPAGVCESNGGQLVAGGGCVLRDAQGKQIVMHYIAGPPARFTSAPYVPPTEVRTRAPAAPQPASSPSAPPGGASYGVQAPSTNNVVSIAQSGATSPQGQTKNTILSKPANNSSGTTDNSMATLAQRQAACKQGGGQLLPGDRCWLKGGDVYDISQNPPKKIAWLPKTLTAAQQKQVCDQMPGTYKDGKCTLKTGDVYDMTVTPPKPIARGSEGGIAKAAAPLAIGAAALYALRFIL